MTFDLERARGLRDFLQDDCAEVGDVWGEMIAEIERLRASLIDLHAEYINTLEKNPECSAWDLDEQSDADQRRLRKNAAHAISIVEPPIYLQVDQQATLTKSLKKEIRRLKHESKVEQELTNSYIKHLHEAEARIKELEAERAVWIRHYNDTRKKHVALKKLGKMVRQRGKWLVEERANKMIQSDDCTQNEDSADFHHRCICEYNVKKCPMEQWWLDRARITLQAEGKIYNGGHIAETDQMVPCWQITVERKDVIGICLRMLRREASFFTSRQNRDAALETLRAMLRESEQCKWRCAHQ